MHSMQLLKDKLSIIKTAAPTNSNIIYLDIPLHLNVGDLLIYKGTERFFKENNYNVLIRRTDKGSENFVRGNPNVDEETIIMMHGGGNFGDLYIRHQNLREAIVTKFPNNKIVFLPQTVHFKSPEALKKSAKIIRQHKNLTVFCRDVTSEHILKEHFCDNVILCPDMAHSLWDSFPKQKTQDIRRETLWMLRKDIEETDVSKINGVPDRKQFQDWEDICSKEDRNYLWRMDVLERINGKLHKELLPVVPFWDNYTDKLIERINNYFMQYSSVITSRMHGHILCCLLGIPTKLIDNSYGKNLGYYHSWTNNVPNCELITL